MDIHASSNMYERLRVCGTTEEVPHLPQSPRGKNIVGPINNVKEPSACGHMDIGSDNEDIPLTLLNGKKMQRVVGEVSLVSKNIDSATPDVMNDVSASSVKQGSRIP
ncbi:hypothetical protein V6N13_010072 [Hibiscus sabdariffa]